MPNAVCKASNGYILFGGINGITSFKPESFTDNPFAPPVLITELKLFDKIVKPGDETGLLTSQISQTQRIVLRHDQSMISLKLAVANFVSVRTIPLPISWKDMIISGIILLMTVTLSIPIFH